MKVSSFSKKKKNQEDFGRKIKGVIVQFLHAVSHSVGAHYSTAACRQHQQQQQRRRGRGRGQSGASGADVTGVGISNGCSCISL